MAELFETGTNRIIYRSESFVEGLTVTAYIWNPSLVKSSLQTFTEIEEGLFYLDYDFTVSGTYTGVFYEDAAKKTSGVFRVSLINNVSASAVVTALKEEDSWLTASGSGSMTFKQIIAVLTSWAAGKVVDSGVDGIYDILDPEDDSTIILKVTPSEITPFKDMTIL